MNFAGVHVYPFASLLLFFVGLTVWAGMDLWSSDFAPGQQ